MRNGIRRPTPSRSVVAGRRNAPGIRTPPGYQPGAEPQKGLSRRDLLVAGMGVATGVVTAAATGLAMERLGPAVASSGLAAFPTIQWSPDGSWLFYADEPIDLADQSDGFIDENENFMQEAAIDYLLHRGCVRCSPLVVHLHLSRPGDSPAVIHDIRLVNHRRAPALSGASYLSETAGANPNTVLAVNLDASAPVPVQSDYMELMSGADVSGRPPAFSTITVSVEPHLTETITIGFLTQNGRHAFQLGVDYLVEGREHTIVTPEDVDLLRVTQAVDAREAYELPWYDSVYRYVAQG
jgi:hypothetical protein